MRIMRLLAALAALSLAACEQVVLVGPVGDASITVTELRTGALVAQGTTDNEADVIARKGQSVYDAFSDIRKLRQLGQTSYTQDVNYAAATWYVITVSGGFDYDPDGNQVLNAPTQVQGRLHGLFTGATLNAGGFAVSPQTEALYQWIIDHVDVLDNNAIQQALDTGAAQLTADVDSSGTVNYADVLIANPTQNTWNPVASLAALDSLSQAIAAGSSEAVVDQRALALFDAGSPEGVPEARYATVSATLEDKCGPGCHYAGGSGSNGSDNDIFPPSDPDYVAKNTGNFRDLVASDGVDYVLNKASGSIGHGGGRRLTPGNADYIAFEAWLKLL